MAQGRKTGGRKKGTVNKKTQDVIDKLDALKCDPIEGMAKLALQALEDGDVQLAGNMYKELAQYVAPKRKAVDINANLDVSDPMKELLEHIAVHGSGFGPRD